MIIKRENNLLYIQVHVHLVQEVKPQVNYRQRWSSFPKLNAGGNYIYIIQKVWAKLTTTVEMRAITHAEQNGL